MADKGAVEVAGTRASSMVSKSFAALRTYSDAHLTARLRKPLTGPLVILVPVHDCLSGRPVDQGKRSLRD
jgi:hypothetical protein